MSDRPVSIRHIEGDRFAIRIRGHELSVDQPLDAGGSDAAPTPTELFVASLAACAAFFAGRFLRRHVRAGAEWGVDCRYSWSAARPSRVTDVEIAMLLPEGISDDLRQGALRAAEHCTVRESIGAGLDVRVSAAPSETPP